MSKPLSPQAQAVAQAARAAYWLPDQECPGEPDTIAAAALRPAADQVVPEEPEPYTPDYPDSNGIYPFHVWDAKRQVRADLLAIAAELEQ